VGMMLGFKRKFERETAPKHFSSPPNLEHQLVVELRVLRAILAPDAAIFSKS